MSAYAFVVDLVKDPVKEGSLTDGTDKGNPMRKRGIRFCPLAYASGYHPYYILTIFTFVGRELTRSRTVDSHLPLAC